MTTTPKLWESLSQANTTEGFAWDGQVKGSVDGSYFVVWTDNGVIVGRKYDVFGNPAGDEIRGLSPILAGNFSPAISGTTEGG